MHHWFKCDKFIHFIPIYLINPIGNRNHVRNWLNSNDKPSYGLSCNFSTNTHTHTKETKQKSHKKNRVKQVNFEIENYRVTFMWQMFELSLFKMWSKIPRKLIHHRLFPWNCISLAFPKKLVISYDSREHLHSSFVYIL